ncbi:MAG: YhjD/YihY/BrkB family envelope integrity protein [Alphaproteobacteria bacterium]
MDDEKQQDQGFRFAGRTVPSMSEAKDAIGSMVWRYREESLPFWKAVLLRSFRIGFATARDLMEGQLTLRAMSLVYTTLLSLVPLLAISFSVLKGFGVHNQIEPVLNNLTAPLGDQGGQITRQIISFVENVKVGVLGFIGFGLLFYTVVSLMQKIERAVNYIWRVTRERSFAQRVRDYLSVVLVGPALVFASVGISATVANNAVVQSLMKFQPFGWLLEVAAMAVPYLMVVAAFTFIYMFMPNTGVRLRSAFVGALVAGALWNIVGWGFASFVVGSTNYDAIYSTFATLILFLIWLYIGWLVLLTGACIAFYHQNPSATAGAHKPLSLSNRVKEHVGLMTMAMIGRRFHAGERPWTLEQLTSRLKVPGEVAERAIEALETGGLVLHTGEVPSRYMPARPLEKITVIEILDVVRNAGEERVLSMERLPPDPAVAHVGEDVKEAVMRTLRGRTLRDMILDDGTLHDLTPDTRRAAGG